jgi:hypothetical protein
MNPEIVKQSAEECLKFVNALHNEKFNEFEIQGFRITDSVPSVLNLDLLVWRFFDDTETGIEYRTYRFVVKSTMNTGTEVLSMEDIGVKNTNYQYSEYQIKTHNAHCFCQVPDCPYCSEISKSQRDNPEKWR